MDGQAPELPGARRSCTLDCLRRIHRVQGTVRTMREAAAILPTATLDDDAWDDLLSFRPKLARCALRRIWADAIRRTSTWGRTTRKRARGGSRRSLASVVMTKRARSVRTPSPWRKRYSKGVRVIVSPCTRNRLWRASLGAWRART